MKNLNSLQQFRLIAILEGISYLLFAVTMPLKYMYEILEPNFYVGMIHGILFIAYLMLGVRCWVIYKWSIGFVALAVLASLLPFGTFYLDAKYLKKQMV
jgi:integral membrane protein